ncbi:MULTISPECIES: ABC transporter ATP-binding protein [Arthrobacter]|jgi:NitT/TauT family transport system ATP-binding protein|uniref:ABC transporter ATP-binding protein n=1 Tax=Arthrobacter TaxID=1663 RepID=UPI001F300484|nr:MULTISPECIES: ABC transporter ATP-binding protein [Arthrobacter]MDP9989303.1 NitT/TauT family transport system ATP-binding protein [Arthrobacter oryzae]UKA75245.1 ABC transporter ATP-binding protein [Arthrobacter sp. FW306-07-I]
MNQVPTIPSTRQEHDVVFDNIGMTFQTVAGATEAVANVSGSIPEHKFVSVIGPSGCGKSTLLDMVGGLLKPTRGSVSIDGETVTAPRRDTAMVFQEDSTLHWRSVLDNVAFGLEVKGVPKAERHARAREMIELVGLRQFEDHRPGQLSGGMKQRVAIARALAMEPRVLLMDEPFGALDQQTRQFIGRELLRIWEKTRNRVLFITHDIQEAVYLSDEVWVMSARPSVVKEVVKIDLPRPRPEGTHALPRFRELEDHLWSLVKVEAEKTLGPGAQLA